MKMRSELMIGKRIAFSLFISAITFSSAFAKAATMPAFDQSIKLASADDDKHSGKDEDEDKKEKKRKEKADSKEADVADKSKTKADEKKDSPADLPNFQPDQCLISVLKDLSRALKDQDQLKKIADENQRAAVVQATQILDKALAEPNLLSNRIIKPEDNGTVENKLTPEAWGSGEVVVSDDLKGSLTAVWAKRLNSSLHLAIAGDDIKTNAPNGKPIGQFVIEIEAKTSTQKGFDIQSQTDVHFWLGEIKSIAVDADCCPVAEAAPAEETQTPADQNTKPAEDEKKKSSLVLPVIATSRLEQYLAKVREIEEAKLAQLSKTKPIQPAVVADVLIGDDVAATKQEVKPEPKPEVKKEVKPEPASEPNKEVKPEPNLNAVPESRKDEQLHVGMPSARPETQERLASGWGSAPISNNPTSNSVIPTAASANQPSADARLFLPDRAIAGKAMTVTVINAKNQGEGDVEVGFNGATVATDNLGRAEFIVPDDATPGRSLSVVLAARPEILPSRIDVLQPLLISPDQQSPRIEAWPSAATPGQLFVINGHSFDGIPGHSRVVLDDFSELPILAVSPVQVKAHISQDIPPGPHNIRVESNGIQSQKAGFNVVTVEVKPEGKDFTHENSNKVRIRVLGTEDKVSLHVTNETPEFVFISRGNDFHMTSPGGAPNDVVLPLERLKRGAFKISAKVE
jgi:hypothetical protein